MKVINRIKRNDGTLIDRVQYWSLFVYVIFVYLFNGSKEYYFLMYIPLLIFIIIELGFILKTRKIRVNKYILAMFLFVSICFLTCIWAQDKDLAMSKAVTVLSLTIALTFMYNYCVRTKKKVEDILMILLVAGLLFSVYILGYYGMDNLSRMFEDKYSRIGEEIDNVNVIGMELAMTAIVAIYFGMNKNRMYYFLSVIPIVLALSTASKKAIIFIIIGIILLIILKRKDNFSPVDLIKKIILPVAILVAALIVIQLNVFPALSGRLGEYSNSFTGDGKVDNSTVIRNRYIDYGFNSFLENPIGGIGIGNSDVITMEAAGKETYLHNNYIELLATTGILGTTVYYYIFISMLVFAVKNRKERSAPLVITVLILCLILDWGMVSYYSKVVYIYILLGVLFHSNLNHRKETNVIYDGGEKKCIN